MQEGSPDVEKDPQRAENVGAVPLSWEEKKFDVPVSKVSAGEMDVKLSGVRKILDLGSAGDAEKKEGGGAPTIQAPQPIHQPVEKPRSWLRRIFS